MERSESTDPIGFLLAKSRASGGRIRVEQDLNFDHPELNALRDVWLRKAQEEGGLPSRAALDLRSIHPFARHISIMERVPDEKGTSHYRFRLQGSQLVEYFGSQTGRFLEETIPPENVADWNAGYDALLASGKPLRVLIFYETPGLSYLRSESFAAPLGRKEGSPDSVFLATYLSARVEGMQRAG
ncbi:MAG TPA: hypothetical protein VIJ72_07575 [Rhizomicrobium sp.]